MTTRLRIMAAFALCAALASGCGGGGDSRTGATDDSGSSSAATGGKFPDTITIGYQLIPNGDLVVKHEKLLEAALGPNVKVVWKLFDSGGAVNEAIVAGGIDIGLAGSSAVARGLSTRVDYQVPWIFAVIGKAEALVVKGDKGINSVVDLKGKKVATPFASTSHYSLLAALAQVGLTDTDVTVIDAQPDAIAASWATGDIDAAYVWNPNLAKLVKSGGKVLITSEDLSKKGTTTYDLAVVTDTFATTYPNAVSIWVQQQNKAVKLIKDKPGDAAKSIAAELNISVEEAKSQLGGLIFVNAAGQAGPRYLGGGLASNLFAAAQFNKRLGKIDAVQPEERYKKAVVATFATAAAHS
ncbi:MAG: transporter substrate-binding domain-containing protein [Actinobacteria bacterium]|uniref:Unannotated protein n=1 Tax=freshwater metagenome TaxID=449393 RepID=A0A6J7P3C0_9ZZZZ|nr:transporter substrate-binding domain-containing protein [Actinomycetota bacterium]MSW92226.1 transporter substrate-binding domain-containing protein [Actinomycetota bacterium]MSX88143.1 transporter substrate-binding domain-containing protein [Actinomycetota bacterium]MSY72844.1 transporter substrate-binding domain-containing protein [Actinomycetota bacterium]